MKTLPFYSFLILFSLIFFNDCRENFNILSVNLTEGRSDLSVVRSSSDEDDTFKIIKGSAEEEFIAKATLIEQINTTGWGHLIIQSSSNFSDILQAYFSGVLEGIISKPLIQANWFNKFEGYCSIPSEYCYKLYKYLKENFISLITKTRKSNGFLKMIRLQLWQIKGLQDGYDNTWKKHKSEINEEYLLEMQNQLFKLYLIQAECDLSALSKILGGSQYHNNFIASDDFVNERCSALIKYVKGSIYIAHVTWDTYDSMLRLTKLYDFPYRINDDETSSDFVPGTRISFSGYPGQLPSLDDFYITSAGLIITETTINNDNDLLWKPLVNMSSLIILSYARAQAANRLATSGKEWATLFSLNNSGTYNNQWMIVDNNVMKNHRHGQDLPDKLLYVVEELPSLIISKDVTDHLRKTSYWASYNLPYYEEIWKLGKFQKRVLRYGDFFDYNKCPRALIFKRNCSFIVDYVTMMRLMRYNDFRNDPLAKCECNPPYSGINGISSRNDLNLKSGIYSISLQGYKLYGGIDMKFTTSNLANSMNFIAINGPTYDQQPVFDWTQVKNSYHKHYLHPTKFQYSPFLTPFK